MSYRKTKAGYWVVPYRDANGKGRTRSFGKGVKGKKAAQAFDAEVQYKKTHDEALPLTRADGVYLDQITQEWVDAKLAQGRKKQWLEDWVHIFNEHFLEPLTLRPAHLIKQSDVLAIIKAKYGHAAQSTRNRYIGYIKSIFEFGVQQGHVPKNPLASWVKGKEDSHNSPLTLKDLKKIQAYAAREKSRSKHLAWAIEVAWNVPCRPGQADLFALRYDQNYKPDRRGFEVFHSKVGKWAFIPCSEEFLQEVERRSKISESGYIIEYAGRQVKRMDTAISTAAEKVGLPYPVCFYDVRHLWITTMLDKGLEPGAVANMTGTSVEMIVKNYYEDDKAEKMRSVKLLPKLQEKPKKRARKVVNLGEAKDEMS